MRGETTERHVMKRDGQRWPAPYSQDGVPKRCAPKDVYFLNIFYYLFVVRRKKSAVGRTVSNKIPPKNTEGNKAKVGEQKMNCKRWRLSRGLPFLYSCWLRYCLVIILMCLLWGVKAMPKSNAFPLRIYLCGLCPIVETTGIFYFSEENLSAWRQQVARRVMRCPTFYKPVQKWVTLSGKSQNIKTLKISPSPTG